MRVPICVITSDANSDECGDTCPFLDGHYCSLFSVKLGDKTLPPGQARNDCEPTKLRCFGCSEL